MHFQFRESILVTNSKRLHLVVFIFWVVLTHFLSLYVNFQIFKKLYSYINKASRHPYHRLYSSIKHSRRTVILTQSRSLEDLSNNLLKKEWACLLSSGTSLEQSESTNSKYRIYLKSILHWYLNFLNILMLFLSLS